MSGTGRLKGCSVAPVIFALVLGGSGCDSFRDLVLPMMGILQVTTVTGGINIDPDGYQLLT